MLAIALCTVGIVLAALGFAANPAPAGWSLITAPNANASQTLNGVTCSSASDCWAVSYRPDQTTLIEHWDGTSWTIVNSPNYTTPDNFVMKSFLIDVTCASASNCWAVGNYINALDQPPLGRQAPLIEKWDGTSWTVVSVPDPGLQSISAVLKSVTCASASDCWAVGSVDNGGVSQPLFEHWNGTAWVIVPSTNSGTSSFLNGVTCASASDCWAVGYSHTGSVNQTLIERWNGISWSVVASPNTSSTQNNQFNGVTCASASECWAAGTSTNGGVDQSLIARWDGNLWTIATTPNPATGALLNSVTCSSPSECWAVGKVSKIDRTFIERWDGTSWTIATLPNVGGSLNDVACASGAECWAVGNANRQALAQRWNGTSWAIVTSPNLLAPYLPALTAVTCASASECWAIGPDSIIAQWNGTSWTIVNAPIPFRGVLNRVTCASASECWAVGSYYNGNILQTLIERWDGNSWAIVNSPNSSTAQNNILNGVACASASDCWAVGYSDGTLIERWDGTSWTIVPSPNYIFGSSLLLSVACASPSECWCVGYWTDGESGGNLFEEWNGTSWSIAVVPDTIGFNSVTCSSASDCWVVGNGSIGRWNGTAWANFPSPGLAGQLSDVACTSPSDCWAVGYSDAGNDIGVTLIERWDGSSWSLAPSPNLGPQSSSLAGAACASSSDCWTVGYNNNTDRKTLIERYSLTIPPLAGVVSRKVHGSAGTFDIDLPLIGTRGIECRSGGANSNYQMVFTFVNNVASCGSASMGTLSNEPNSNQCTVNLTSVPNQQYLTVTLSNVLDSQANTGSVSGTMGVLVGDVNASGRVDSGDVSLVRGQTLQPIDLSNFREDINASGRIDSGDVSVARQQTLTSLPSTP